MDRETLRDWVHHYHREGLAGLRDRHGGGCEAKLSPAQRAELAALVEAGPDPALFTPIRRPKSNGMSESFVKTLKRDYARVPILPDAHAILAMLPDGIEDYCEVHPHSGPKFRFDASCSVAANVRDNYRFAERKPPSLRRLRGAPRIQRLQRALAPTQDLAARLAGASARAALNLHAWASAPARAGRRSE